MKSDSIKAVIATFFHEIERLIETEIKKSPTIKIEDLIAFLLTLSD